MAQPVLDTIKLFAKAYIDFYLPGCTRDDDEGWYTLPLADLGKVKNVPLNHVKLVISQVHGLGYSRVSKPIEETHYMYQDELLSHLGRLDCFPLMCVRLVNIQRWDYRFNCLLSLLQTRTKAIEFDSVKGSGFVPAFYSLVLVNGPSFLRSLLWKTYDNAVSLTDFCMFLDACSRVADLSSLHLDVRPESGCSPDLLSDLCSRIAQMRNLEELQLCGEIFEYLSSRSAIGDVLYNGINEAKVRSITVKSFCEARGDRTYQLSFSALQECVCAEMAANLEEIHLSRVLLTQNHRRNKSTCENVRVLDLKTAFNSACERLVEDVLGLFPNLVYCRLDNCCIKSFVPMTEYIAGNKMLREVHMVGNRLDNSDFETVTTCMKDFGHLRILNLRKNSVAIMNKMRNAWYGELMESRLEDFVWEHKEWKWKWGGNWRNLTGGLCIHQMFNFLDDRRAEIGGEIRDSMWPGIFAKAIRMGEWDDTARKCMDNRTEYNGNPICSFYRASMKETKEMDVRTVVHWLLTNPYAKAMACGGSTVEDEKLENRKRKRAEHIKL